MRYAIIPDIIVDGRCPTQAEYDAAQSLLRELARGPVSAWRATTLTDVETRAWIAIHRAGLARNVDGAVWNTVHMTERGRVYLEQRP